MPFNFDVPILPVANLSQFPNFEAPLPSNFDKQYVVKCISQFFNACNFLDRWVHESFSSDSLSNSSSINLINNQSHTFSTSIISIESDNHYHVREFSPVNEIQSNWGGELILVNCAQPLEGTDFSVNQFNRPSCQSTTPLEGACSLDIRTNPRLSTLNETSFSSVIRKRALQLMLKILANQL